MIDVAVGVLRRRDGRVLIVERPHGKSFAGAWEFPGGKLESGEAPQQAVERELSEELGIRVGPVMPLICAHHEYEAFHVRLWAYEITKWKGVLHGCEGQRTDWVPLDELDTKALLPADRPIIDALRLPRLCRVTPPDTSVANLIQLLKRPIGYDRSVVVIRSRGIEADALAADCQILRHWADRSRLTLILHHRIAQLCTPQTLSAFDGVHLSSAALRKIGSRPQGSRPWLVGASVHDSGEAQMAHSFGLDYVLVGSVRTTPSHPGGVYIGWRRFEELAQASGVPAYAIGGMSPRNLDTARRHWGQGVAGIRAFGINFNSALNEEP